MATILLLDRMGVVRLWISVKNGEEYESCIKMFLSASLELIIGPIHLLFKSFFLILLAYGVYLVHSRMESLIYVLLERICPLVSHL